MFLEAIIVEPANNEGQWVVGDVTTALTHNILLCYNVTQQRNDNMETTMTVRLSGEDKSLITRYAQIKGVSVSDLVREAILERIEDEIDMELYRQGMEEFLKNPLTYSFEEVAKDIGLDL